jgi:hypothetical protein
MDQFGNYEDKRHDAADRADNMKRVEARSVPR